MTTDELLQLFTGEKAYRQLAAEIRPGRSVGLASLTGSALSLVAAAAVRQTGGLHVFVMEDRDAAGYLYNDLFPLLGEERLLFFPTGYKRSIQFGQEDPSGIVQRTGGVRARKNKDGTAQCTADAAGGIPGALYLSGSAGRKSRRPAAAPRKHPDAAQRRPSLDGIRRRNPHDEPFRKGRFRLRTGTILGTRRNHRHFFVFVQRAVPHRLFRR